MLFKAIFLSLSICFFTQLVNAQENRLLIVNKDETTSSIKKGENVRLAYPSANLKLNSNKKYPQIMGFRGRVDSISNDQVWLMVDKRTKKQLAFKVEDIIAIKKVSKSAEVLTFVGTFLVIGGSAAVATSVADVNPAITAFSAAFSIFPSAIITANIFYPNKPHDKVGKDYTLKIITIN